MKKTSIIVKEKNTYDVNMLINNTAYVISITGKTGLLNIKTNEIIGEMDNFYITYDAKDKFYYQEKEIEDIGESSKKNNLNSRKIVKIYDALNEKMLVDGWEVVKNFGDHYYGLAAVKSPIDDKIHLFDKDACRKPTNIFDMPLDDVENLYSNYNNTYLVVTMNGKKGLYQTGDKGSSLITPIEFDNIEKMPNIIVYTKGNEKHFVCPAGNRKVSESFNTISIDEWNKDIVYGKKENTTYVYNTTEQKLLLKTDCDEIKFFRRKGDYCSEFLFITKKDDKLGLMSSIIDNGIRKYSNLEAKGITLLEPNYDKITEDNNGNFYLEKDKKIGIFLGDYSYHDNLVNPEYDKIDYLGDSYYALYKGDSCDIGRVDISTPYQPIVTNCQIEADLSRGVIYKKDDLLGLLLLNSSCKDAVTPNEYDKISCVGEYYFILEKNGKKGVLHLGEIIIPMEYEDIAFGARNSKYRNQTDSNTVYFALKKGEKEYELAKRIDYHYYNSSNNGNSNRDCPIEFISNHIFEGIEFLKDIMVLKDPSHVYVCNYEENLLKTFPSNTLITSFAKPGDEYAKKRNNKDDFYCVDGTYYYYKDGKFEEAYIEENDFYVTTYETDTDSFEIKTLNKQEHDAFCDHIDTQADDLAEQSLVEMSADAQILKKKYPTLVLRKVKKAKI